LEDPEARHYRASIGHAVSTDLTDWTRVEDALVRSDAPAFDDLATWTGSVVRGDDGLWRMFYTGSTLAPDGVKNIQSIGVATSKDLYSWRKSAANPILATDRRFYETLTAEWHDEAFRDPWVFADPRGAGWHMLVTARGKEGAPFGRGVVGHATSADLDHWTVQPPLTHPLEVMQSELIDGDPVLIFSCLAEHASPSRGEHPGGVWAAPAMGLAGPFDIAGAYPLTDARLYSGRLVQRRDGSWAMLAFRLEGEDLPFVGDITDPLPVTWDSGRLVVSAPED